MGLVRKVAFFIAGSFFLFLLIPLSDSILPILLILPLFWFIFLRDNSDPQLESKTISNQNIKEIKMNDEITNIINDIYHASERAKNICNSSDNPSDLIESLNDIITWANEALDIVET
ncbi:MAG: hypothetical protein O3C38_05975 [Proteobacteria bacterium]|nr:hypothetical protein [Pseudomonadota bacterium]MDA1037036.1 hypothetical protein [Pseudomonadota bacterium]